MSSTGKILIGIGIIGAIIFFFHRDPSIKETGAVKGTASVEKALYKDNNPECHPSYSGCLKANANDYDCAGGSGNGPYYTGKVRVIGPDVFGLDRDRDGWGCE